MHVLDSSVWIYAITRTCDDAVAVVDQVLDGDLRVAVDAYVFNEVIEGIERSGSTYDAITEAQTRFAEIVHGSPAVQEPTQRRVQALDLDTVRSDERVQLLGLTWDIQPKDVPGELSTLSAATFSSRIRQIRQGARAPRRVATPPRSGV